MDEKAGVTSDETGRVDQVDGGQRQDDGVDHLAVLANDLFQFLKEKAEPEEITSRVMVGAMAQASACLISQAPSSIRFDVLGTFTGDVVRLVGMYLSEREAQGAVEAHQGSQTIVLDASTQEGMDALRRALGGGQ